MAIKETNILKKIQVEICKTGARLLRNNTGLFLTIDGKRKLHAGLGQGTSDLIGWVPCVVTADMVGKKIAIFTAIEVKTKKGRQEKLQQNFINKILQDGGYAGFATNDQEVEKIINIK